MTAAMITLLACVLLVWIIDPWKPIKKRRILEIMSDYRIYSGLDIIKEDQKRGAVLDRGSVYVLLNSMCDDELIAHDKRIGMDFPKHTYQITHRGLTYLEEHN